VQAIMVNGEFKCLGSTQHLKNKFGEGFVLTLKLKRVLTEEGDLSKTESQEMFEEKNSVKEFIQLKFKNAVLK
jgi:ATP-binding cassette, subfamily A (ABC1), member 3